MDEYSTDLNMDDHHNDEYNDVWSDEDDLKLGTMPHELWSDCPLDQHPPDPENRLADQVELQRLSSMGALEEVEFGNLGQKEQLTTKFVYDWRQKEHVDGLGVTSKKWLRRSRLVAREFSFWEKRSDTYSPASSTHILNLLPMMFLQQLSDTPASDSRVQADPYVLGTVDIKDAFIMVDQQTPMSIRMLGKYYKVKKILPGQRLGAKAWYWHFRKMLMREFGFEWCLEQPCLARNSHCCVLLHVHDVFFCGEASYWQNTFLKKLEAEFKISHSQLSGIGSEISFLKRRIKRVEQGLALISGTSAWKVIESFESHFGKVRMQSVPSDASIQTADPSRTLSAVDAHAYRSVIGTLLYLARDRPDLLFTVKELSSSMSQPTMTSVARLKKLVGYLKTTSDMCMVLEPPCAGTGKWKSSDQFWLLESYSDSDWSGHQANHEMAAQCTHDVVPQSRAKFH
eukprot:s881_g11.t1